MEDVQKRLQEASANCVNAHKEWIGNQKDAKLRESLMECVHELRKVAARLEIDLAISERDQMGNKPIPIPSHRSNPRGGRGGKGGHDKGAPKGDNNSDDNAGNNNGGSDVKVESKPSRRRASSNKGE